MSNAITYAYDMKRKFFGKQPLFSATTEVMLDSINPNPVDQKKYGLRNPVNRDSQATSPMSQHIMNTITVGKMNRCINHAEGGWPKDINYANEEETIRYRRRIEREDAYIHCIMSLTPKFEKYISQNNAIEIYEQYFEGMPEMPTPVIPSVRLNNEYRDPDQRAISDICWTNEDNTKLVVAYCSKTFPITEPDDPNLVCHVWDLDNPYEPAYEFVPPAPCWVVVSSPANPAIIIGGLEDGTVCVFDIRAEKQIIAISSAHTAHRGPVNALLNIASRHNNEFFTGSSDGQCIWHDIRNLSEPFNALFMSVNIPPKQDASFSNAEGVSSLQYERTLPTRFLCGTETGLVLSINRRGKTYSDIMSGVYKAHIGPVRSVHRSPCTSKVFLTCGDWAVHIWSEDIKTSPIIMGTSHRYQIMDAVWAPNRLSGYMTVSTDGKFRYWDLLRSYRSPIITESVSKNSLLKVVPHEQSHLVAIADNSGTAYLVSMSTGLSMSDEKEKPLLLQIYERECHREQILASRMKEIRLKAKGDGFGEQGVQTEEQYNEEALIKAAEDEYRREVIDEIRKSGLAQKFYQADTMRKR